MLHLAHVKLEVSRSKQYVSSVMQVLEPALDELEARGYCRWYPTDAQTNSGKKLVFERIEHPQAVAEEGPAALSPEERRRFDALVERGLTQETARELATGHGPDRVDRQLAHFDWLCENDKAPRSGGWLVAAIEKDYSLPPTLAHLERNARPPLGAGPRAGEPYRARGRPSLLTSPRSPKPIGPPCLARRPCALTVQPVSLRNRLADENFRLLANDPYQRCL